MTWHFFESEDVGCPSCQARFIPFEPLQPCPRCGAIAVKHFDFVSELVVALKIHKADYGRYTSGAYFVGSAAESVFHWTCRILDSVEAKPAASMSHQMGACLDSIDWGEFGFMKAYFQKLLPRVWQELQRQEKQS